MIYYLIILLIIYIVIAAAMFMMQRKLLYHPNRNWLDTTQYSTLPIHKHHIIANDGIKLETWLIPGCQQSPTVIYYHGNAGSLHDRLDKFTVLHNAGFNILALSYRGYGNSLGQPTEKGIYLDAEALLQYALNELNINLDHIILYGESLGSGVAIEMATRYQVAAIILEAPYTSVVNRAAELYPWLPVSLLLVDRYDTIAKIDKIKSPLLIFHNNNDEVIPVVHGKILFAKAKVEKQAYWLDGKTHTDFDWEFIADKIKQFLQRYLAANFAGVTCNRQNMSK